MITRFAARAPTALGPNVTLTMQDEATSSEAPHRLLVIVKSRAFGPDVTIEEIVIALVPWFVSVTV